MPEKCSTDLNFPHVSKNNSINGQNLDWVNYKENLDNLLSFSGL